MAKEEEKESKPESKSDKKGLDHHLKKKVSVPVVVIIAVVALLLVFTVVRLPYQAKESYTEIQEVQVEKEVDDLNNPQSVKVCEDVPSDYKIDYNNFVKVEKLGLNEYCWAEIVIWNNEPSEGEWTIDFYFTVNGLEAPPIRVTEKISGKDKLPLEFTYEDCVSTDTRTGRYSVVKAPTTQECRFETQYPKKTVTEIEKREVPKERLVTKYESIWQALLGINSKEKV